MEEKGQLNNRTLIVSIECESENGWSRTVTI